MKADDGRLQDGFIIWEDAKVLVRAYDLQPLDLSNASDIVAEEARRKLQLLLNQFKIGESLQFIWSADSDYLDMLNAYRADTERLKDYMMPWSYIVRNEVENDFRVLMEKSELRRERLLLFIGYDFTLFDPAGDYNDDLLKSAQIHANNRFDYIRQILGGECTVLQLTEHEIFQSFLKTFNPSLLGVGSRHSRYNPEKTLMENVVRSDIYGKNHTPREKYSLSYDSHYHNLFIVDKFPESIYMGLIYELTRLHFLDYRIIMNIYPQDLEKEIQKAAAIEAKLRGGKDKDPRIQHDWEAAYKRVLDLESGETTPFCVEIFIHTWATDTDSLAHKTASIEGALGKMNNCKAILTNFDAQSLKVFLKTIPGNMHCRYNPHAVYLPADCVAALIPFSATYVGWKFSTPQALWHGDNKNIVGMVNIYNNQPQHCAVFGSAGSGKSAQMNSLLSQTEPYYGYTCLIEEGLSYGLYTATMGSHPIVLTPTSRTSINYLDTYGMPVTPDQISGATLLLAMMCGESNSAEDTNIRFAMLQDFVQGLYAETAEQWCRDNDHRQRDVARLALASYRYLEEFMPATAGICDAYKEYLENRKDFKEEFEDSLEIKALTDFMVSPESRKKFHAFVFTQFETTDYPIHSDMVSYVQSIDDPARYDKDKVRRIVSLLSAWESTGSYGCLFDGHTNVDIRGRIAHFELGRISDSQVELKRMAAFLILHNVRNHVMSLPRNINKRLVFEEAGRFMTLPGGDRLIKEGYEQLRKNRCWVVSIVQQYEKFRGTSIRSAVIGNSLQFILLRQTDPIDVSNLCDVEKEGIEIPKAMQRKILEFPFPAYMPKGKSYSSFCYFQRSAAGPLIGVGRNICSPAQLYVSASSSNDFEKRMREVLQGKGRTPADIAKRIVELADEEAAREKSAELELRNI